MDSEKLNRWLTLGANVGVLIGIVLILAELNQNATIIRGQTRSDVSLALVDLLSQVATDPQLASLIRRSGTGEQLTPEEQVQIDHREMAMFRYFENVYYQYRQGLYDEREYLPQRKAWSIYSPARLQFWCRNRLLFSPDFMTEMDRLLDLDKCSGDQRQAE